MQANQPARSGIDAPERAPVKRKAFRFRIHHDIDLLKEVQANRPFAAAHGDVRAAWDFIAANLSRYFDTDLSSTAAQRRFDALVRAFNKKEMESLRASVTDEEFEERDRYLTELKQMMDDAEIERAERASKTEERAKAKDAAVKKMMEQTLLRLEPRKPRPRKRSPSKRWASSDSSSTDSGVGPDEPGKRPAKTRRSSANSSQDDTLMSWLESQKESHKARLELLQRQMELNEQRFALERSERVQSLQLQGKLMDLIDKMIQKLQ